MALRDIFSKLLGKVRESISEPSEFGEEEFDKDLVVGEETGLEAGEKDFLEETEPAAEKEEKPEEEFETEFKEHEPAVSSPSADFASQFEIIKGKLDLIDAHLKSMEAKEEIFKSEADRLVQYFNFISEKIDHLERELAEVERLVKKRD